MNIQKIISQEESSFNAEVNVKNEIKKNKSEILLPFAMAIFDFLEAIQNDEKFLFNSQAHPSERDWTPLYSKTSLTLEYYRGEAEKEIKENALSKHLMRSFGYGNYQSKWLAFRVSDDFKPSVSFSSDMTQKEDEVYYSVEDAIRAMTKFFLAKRKK